MKSLISQQRRKCPKPVMIKFSQTCLCKTFWNVDATQSAVVQSILPQALFFFRRSDEITSRATSDL